METTLDCVPCTLRQILEASRMVSDDTEMHERIMDAVLEEIRNYKAHVRPPELNRAMHRVAYRYTGVADPYRKLKEKDTEAALRLYPSLKQRAEREEDPVPLAIRIAVTGNVIDSAVGASVDIAQCIEQELIKPFAIYDVAEFEKRLKTARRILVVGDNAGETVFDRVLIETLAHCDITYAVRSGPILNDATVEDALAAGLGGCARVISTGSDMPGVGLDEATDEFLEVFRGADIVISKGQGNFETLEDSGRNIFFLLKAKCASISRRLGVKQGEYVFQYLP
jgi:damage-control phosphatase, subfamily I